MHLTYFADVSGVIFSVVVWAFFALFAVIVAQLFLLPSTLLGWDFLKRKAHPFKPHILGIMLALANLVLGIIFLRLALQNIHNARAFRHGGDIYLQIAPIIDITFLIARYMRRRTSR